MIAFNLSIKTPSEINKKLALKRKADEHRNYITSVNNKRPCYRGTIYESRLLPMPPSTVLPVYSPVYRPAVDRHTASVDESMQAKLLTLLDDTATKTHDLKEFLAENSDKININQYGEDGVTPLHRLCQTGSGDVEVAATLIRFGADPRLTSRDGWSAFHMASFSGNIKLMRYLMSIRSS